jgi:hypothetical protein
MAMGKNRDAFLRSVRVFRAAFMAAFMASSSRTLELLTYKLDEDAQEVTEQVGAIAGGTIVPPHRDRLIYKDVTWYGFDTSAEVRAEALKFKRTDWNSDRHGHHAAMSARYAQRVRSSQRRQAVEKLVSGFTSDVGVLDGQNFFDTDHETADNRTYSNLQSGALSTSTFDAAYSKLLGMPTLDGEPIFELADGEIDVRLVVGPKLKATADDIVKATISGGETNPRANRAIVTTLSDLREGGPLDDYKNYWFLMLANLDLIGGEEFKPLTRLEPEEPEIEFRMDPNDPRAWEYDELEFKIRGNHGFGFRWPGAIVGSTGA